MKLIIPVTIAIAAAFVGCTPIGAPPVSPAQAPSAASAPSPSAPSTATKPADQRKRVRAVYENCTVYAGATDYYFRNAAGQRLEFRNSNFPGEKAVKINVKLVDDSGQSEGPPGPNPFWVGKDFFLIYDSAGSIVEAVPAS